MTWGTVLRGQIFVPQADRNQSCFRVENEQDFNRAQFFSGCISYFVVAIVIGANSKHCCGFASQVCCAVISLHSNRHVCIPLFVLIFDYSEKYNMTESGIKGRKREVWDKTETASLIGLVFKNPAIWNTKSRILNSKSILTGWKKSAKTKINS